MNLIDLQRDWWPYLKCVKVKMYGRFVDTPEDVAVTWAAVTTIDKDTRFDGISKQATFSWWFSKTHAWMDVIMCILDENDDKVVGLTFVITAIHTKTGVILKGEDVNRFFDHYFNRTLYNESMRREMHSRDRIPIESFMKRASA